MSLSAFLCLIFPFWTTRQPIRSRRFCFFSVLQKDALGRRCVVLSLVRLCLWNVSVPFASCLPCVVAWKSPLLAFLSTPPCLASQLFRLSPLFRPLSLARSNIALFCL
ncbi:hypothetical protein TGMAS_267530 [Toxoplasma gondii MAS]|uniref:Uncharacterized protein n=1 Tax=Toxoplasma gondii MAS TaxID=943118 RepID=A0A086QMA8_TOXGO|nr:hypothetical protein TGMAS_267530 [Toxoplasma gondii MAS]